jgi:hypothetical protein
MLCCDAESPRRPRREAAAEPVADKRPAKRFARPAAERRRSFRALFSRRPRHAAERSGEPLFGSSVA